MRRTLRRGSVSHTTSPGHKVISLTITVAKYICTQTAPVYGLFSLPILKCVFWRIEWQETLVFACSVPTCQHKVNVYTDTKDVGSTSNLRKHAKACRGEHRLAQADEAGTAAQVCSTLREVDDGTITATFLRSSKGKVSYSTCSLSETQIR